MLPPKKDPRKSRRVKIEMMTTKKNIKNV